MDLIDEINKKVSDSEIEKIIRTAIPHTNDREEVAYMMGFRKGGEKIREKIIQIIKNGLNK